jgi:unsaturated rhamnogalacturonyl hydrolase
MQPRNPAVVVTRFLVCLASGWAVLSSSMPQLQAADPGRIQSRAEVLAIMHKVNDWQSRHPVMSPDDRDWERGTWYTGVMAAWKATRDPKFLNQALDWGRQHQWQVGREEAGANRLFCVETWLELYFFKKDKGMIEPAIKWLDTNAPNSPAGARRWYLASDRSYVDSLYGASALAMLTKATRNGKYLTIMHAFFDDVTGELFDKEAGLYYRDNRYIGRNTASGKKILWSRGNGWAFAGIARVLEYLPKGNQNRREYVGIFRRMAAELVKRQGADGLWRPNLDDPEQVPVPETSGSGFFCYGLAWGVNHGLLDRARYLPVVRKAWAGLCRSVDSEGKVQWGQQVDAEPNMLKQESTHEYVTGTFLLAGSEMYKLASRRR